MSRLVLPSLAGAAAVLALAPTAHADRRAFTNTYEYMTMPDAETELEIYSQQSRQTFHGNPPQAFSLELEIEHGITDRWDVALYHVFEQEKGADATGDVAFHFAEMKLETRYRFSERGEWPVDLEIYGEGVKVFGEGTYETEGRIIAARDFDDLTVVVNAVGAVGFGDAYPDKPEIEVGWGGGVTYEVVPELKLGAESWGAFALDDVNGTIKGYAGPAISWAPATGLWAAVTPGFGITSGADDVVVRLAVGLHIQ